MDYSSLVEVYERIESTTKRLEKTFLISELLKRTRKEDIPCMILLLQGKVFPPYDGRKMGVASKLVVKAINIATGISSPGIEDEWRKTGDLGAVAKNLVKRKKQATLFTEKLTVKKVFENIKKTAEAGGHGAVERKVKLTAELLSSAKPVEAKYVIRTILEDLRVGVAAGTMRDSIAWAYLLQGVQFRYDEKEKSIEISDRGRYNSILEEVQRAYDVTSDFATVAVTAKEKGLEGLSGISLELGKPVKVMLYQKAKGMEDAFNTVGSPAEIEYKYDGFRIQCHKFNGKIMLFTRRLENVTEQFIDVVDHVRKHVKGESFLLDGEAAGYDRKTGKYLPFQNISQRIKRKYDIEEMARKFPVEYNVFDILMYEGKSMLKEPFIRRRDLIEQIIRPEKMKIMPATNMITKSVREAQEFYDKALKAGHEGVMVKNFNAEYKPGSRVGYGVKVKPTMENLDLVVVGADWGEGKRANWLSSYTLACIDGDGNLLEVGKVGTGIKEKSEGVSFQQMTELLKPLIRRQEGRAVEVSPRIVLEVAYEEIQKSPTYSSGFALRFPRVVRIREEKPVDEISSKEMVEGLYYEQKS